MRECFEIIAADEKRIWYSGYSVGFFTGLIVAGVIWLVLKLGGVV